MWPYLTGIHHCANTYSKSHGRDFWQISIKETSIGQDGVHSQGLDPGSRHKTRAGLVESNVTIRSNTCNISSSY